MSVVRNSISKGAGVAVCVMVGLLWFVSLAAAQQPTGTILGVVKDGSGGVISGVTVTVTSSDTGSVRTGTSGVDGSFRFPALQVGMYEIRVEHPGFQQEVHKGLELSVGQEAVQNFMLQVGAVEQTVAVTAEAPMIETTTATVSGLVNENQVRDLPLNARNLIELGTLFPGVSISRSGGQGVPNGFAEKLTIMGTRYNSSLFQLDGANVNDNTNTSGSAAGIMMGVETVKEFNVITNGYSAEYGNHTGGVFNSVTKSGSNSLHGSVFEFLRNAKMDAARWEDNALNSGSKAPYKRNQYGFAVGGPIRRDHTFFFGSYEALKDRLGTTQLYFVPNDALRNTGALPNATTGVVTIVPIAPAVKPFLLSYPQCSTCVDLGDGRVQYVRTQSFPTNENFFTIKIDQHISDKDSMFGRFNYDGADQATGSGLGWNTANSTRNQSVAVNETHLFSPAMINVLLLGFRRTRNTSTYSEIPGFGYPITSFTQFTAAGVNGTISTGAPALAGIGGGGNNPSLAIMNAYQLKDDAFVTRGVHSLKFGFDGQFMQLRRQTYFNGGGAFTFLNLSNFLQGIANQFTGMIPGSDIAVYPKQGVFGMYMQDDWRVTPRFTLNIGLRYEFVTTPNVANGRVSNLHAYLTPGQTPQNLTLGNPMYLNPSLKNWAPRIGFAWDPTGSSKTSIRGGAGIFFDELLAGPFIYSFVSTPPFFRNADLTFNAQNQPIRPNFPDTAFSQQDLLSSSPQTEPIQYIPNQPKVYKTSLTIQRAVTASTSVEVGLSANRGVHLMRVILTNATIAQTDPATGRLFVPNGSPLLFPNFGRVRPKQSDAESTYAGILFQVNQRVSRGLSLRGAYTFSKSIDSGSNFAGSTDFSGSPSQARYLGLHDRGLSAFDLRNVLTVNFTYDLPGRNMKSAAGKALGGWQASGIVTAQSGSPFNPATGQTPSWWQTIGTYPDLITGATVHYDPRNPDSYFCGALVNDHCPSPTSSAYTTPFKIPGAPDSAPNTSNAAGIIGNLGRSFLTGPGIFTTNFVLAKTFPVHENINLQFRSEFYNLFNRANFDLPASTIYLNSSTPTQTFNSQVGRITATTGVPRNVQFGLKIEF